MNRTQPFFLSLTIVLSLIYAAGCSSPAESSEKPTLKQAIPSEELPLHAQLSEGIYQMVQTAETLTLLYQDVINKAEKATGQQKDALLVVADLLDSAGSTLTDANLVAPSEELITANESKFIMQKDKLLETSFTAREDLKEALGTIESKGAIPADVLVKLQTGVVDIIDSLNGSIESLGGDPNVDITAPTDKAG